MERIRNFWRWLMQWLGLARGRQGYQDPIYSHITTTRRGDGNDTPEQNGEGQEMSEDESRRQFLVKVSVGMGGLSAMVAGIPIIGYLLSPILREEPDVWRPIGPLERFPVGETVQVAFLDPTPLPWAGYSARTGATVRQEPEGTFVALSVYCTHTGCPLRWEEGAKLFLCPCHGGTFFQDGSVAAGPPPTPLERYEVRVREGQVEILTRPQPLPD
jgi:menaquinol-cytochrome c reductase iron-sulfur subunit